MVWYFIKIVFSYRPSDFAVPEDMLGVNPEPEFVNFQGIDSKESIPPAYVVWRAGTTTLFVVPACLATWLAESIP